MTRTWKLAIGIFWLSLPAMALRFWLVWNQLPAHIATHFNAAGQPNGWMSREGSLYFALGLMGFFAAIGTIVLTLFRKCENLPWALPGLFYAILAGLYEINDGLLRYNLGEPVHMAWPVIVLVGGGGAAIVALIISQRGSRLAPSTVIAEEVHAAPGFAWIFLLPLVVEAAVIAAIPNTAARIALGASGIALVGAAAMAWSGFHYLFTSAGLEVRALGFRLRSIPADDIRNYAPDTWGAMGGYGIRGIGNKRAYVWGNKGVRIRTSDGEVFLGHNHPERIVHDLDVIKQFSQ